MSTIPTVTPERHIVEMAEGMTRGSRIRATSGRAPATVEGWLQKQGATWHYFRDGKSLCRQHDQGPHHLRPFLNGGAKSNACHLCERALAQRPTIQQRDAVIREAVLGTPAPTPPPASTEPFQVERAGTRSTSFTRMGQGYATLAEAKAEADRLAQTDPASVLYCVFQGWPPQGRPWDIKEQSLYFVKGQRTVKDYARKHAERLAELLTPPAPTPPPAAPQPRDAGSPRFITRDSVAASLELLIAQEVRAARAADRARIQELEAELTTLQATLAGIRAALGAS